MATPHVAGVVAYLIAKDGNISPAAMETKIKNLSTKNAISGIRQSFATTLLRDLLTLLPSASGTANNLLHI